jgi:hypothetical protein
MEVKVMGLDELLCNHLNPLLAHIRRAVHHLHELHIISRFGSANDSSSNSLVTMSPFKKPCRFFAEGKCMKGEACTFSHEAESGNTTAAVASSQTALATSAQPCTFFLKGRCTHGELCRFSHPQNVATAQLAFRAATDFPQQKVMATPKPSTVQQDTRSQVPCRFLTKSSGCQNAACPFLHDLGGPIKASAGHEEMSSEVSLGQPYTCVPSLQKHNQPCDYEIDEDDLTRELAGASTLFGGHGQVLRISLPTDFSIASLTGFAAGTTSEQLAKMLEPFVFKISTDCIRVSGGTPSQNARAIIKVEHPSFAQKLVCSLHTRPTLLSATVLPNDNRKTQCREVHVSWYKSSRLAWLNFGSGDVAWRVSHKFKERKYTVLGQPVKASEPKHSDSDAKWSIRTNHVAWTVVLNDVPGHAQADDIGRAITAPHDIPRHIELGRPSYVTPESNVTAHVRNKLVDCGTLENFYLSPVSTGKRWKATAWFHDEASARNACLLNGKALPILNGGKLTVSMIETAKVKIFTSIFSALRMTFEREARAWRQKHLSVHVYPGDIFTALKVEGEDVKAMKLARKRLNELLEGILLSHDGIQIWSPALAGHGRATQAMKMLEKELKVVIKRDSAKRQLRYYGPPDRLEHATSQIVALLKEIPHASHEISMTPEQFSWVLRGGFQILRSAFEEEETLIFNVVTRKLIINGTREQYEMARAVIDGKLRAPASEDAIPAARGDCPICFCEVENAVQTSCQHSYCLECFEANCLTAASTSKGDFQVRCQGQEGTCPIVFSAEEIKKHVSSGAFEDMLRASFEEYLKRHQTAFHFCPTPDCDTIYRSTTSSNPDPHTCPGCLEPLCTTCHVVHGTYTCAEYKDIASGGIEALARLKKELNIKDCPRCSTPMEKTEGCNHMTCAGCKAHICWVCMEVFKDSRPCYEHMNRAHGGIGLDAYVDGF